MSDSAPESPHMDAVVEFGVPLLLSTPPSTPALAPPLTALAEDMAPYSSSLSGLAVASLTFALLGAIPLALGALQAVLLSHGIVLITAEDFGFSLDPRYNPNLVLQVFFASSMVLLVFPVLAVITGHLARRRIRRAQEQPRGIRYANTALVIAYIQLTLAIAYTQLAFNCTSC